MTTEVRLNKDGSLDEVVGSGPFQLEQMDDGCWFLELGSVAVFLNARGKITATVEERGAAPQAQDVPAGESEGRDAARYRFLRDQPTLGFGIAILIPMEALGENGERLLAPHETDAAIDVALASQAGKGGNL